MGPFDALAVACNTVELIENAIRAAEVCREICERDSLDENNRIEESTASLADANKDLEAMLGKKTTASSTRAAWLQKIANDAVQTVAELGTLLNQLKLSKKQGNVEADGTLKMTLETIWMKDTNEKLRKRLGQQDAAYLVKEL